jgi:SAM-dependent methyltransferase
MQPPRTSTLYNAAASTAFYEERYARGYMEDWPREKKDRVFEVIRSVELPGVGDALDFGCGNGVFTEVLRQALPAGWKVWGCDISETAIQNARARHSGCAFHVAGDPVLRGRRFDFVLSHHVLEHVYDLPAVLGEIAGLAGDSSTMLHILPCGNAGSYEHRLCLLRKDGINPALENRFFFEDEGHVRRLTTDQLDRAFAERGFALAGEYYGNQYHGAVHWITRSNLGLVRALTDPATAATEAARARLDRLRRHLLVLWALRYPVVRVERELRAPHHALRDWAILALALPAYPVSKFVDARVKRRAMREWQSRKTERNGSEMYLIFRRPPPTASLEIAGRDRPPTG